MTRRDRIEVAALADDFNQCRRDVWLELRALWKIKDAASNYRTARFLEQQQAITEAEMYQALDEYEADGAD
jgi:hypothetical protein